MTVEQRLPELEEQARLWEFHGATARYRDRMIDELVASLPRLLSLVRSMQAMVEAAEEFRLAHFSDPPDPD